MLVPLYNPQVKLLAFTFLYYSKWDFVPGNVADGRAADERCDREIRRTRGPSPYGDEGPHLHTVMVLWFFEFLDRIVHRLPSRQLRFPEQSPIYYSIKM